MSRRCVGPPRLRATSRRRQSHGGQQFVRPCRPGRVAGTGGHRAMLGRRDRNRRERRRRTPNAIPSTDRPDRYRRRGRRGDPCRAPRRHLGLGRRLDGTRGMCPEWRRRRGAGVAKLLHTRLSRHGRKTIDVGRRLGSERLRRPGPQSSGANTQRSMSRAVTLRVPTSTGIHTNVRRPAQDRQIPVVSSRVDEGFITFPVLGGT